MLQKIILLIVLVSPLFAQDSVYLILDEPCDSLPVHFRKSDGQFIRKQDKLPDTTGLASLNASGGAQFCRDNINSIRLNVSSDVITIVDLRQESHGFVNGLPVSWYGKYDWANVGKNREEVTSLEERLLDSLKKAGTITVTKIISKDKKSGLLDKTERMTIKVEDVQAEKWMAADHWVGYFRITVTDHRPPLVEDVDRFVEFVNKLHPGEWLHFHCHAGDGRTTTFMAMYDMMRNAKKVSFDDIILRQYLLGGINLGDDDDFPEFDKQYAIERTEFLHRFYEYCRSNNDNFKTLYSFWLRR